MGGKVTVTTTITTIVPVAHHPHLLAAVVAVRKLSCGGGWAAKSRRLLPATLRGAATMLTRRDGRVPMRSSRRGFACCSTVHRLAWKTHNRTARNFCADSEPLEWSKPMRRPLRLLFIATSAALLVVNGARIRSAARRDEPVRWHLERRDQTSQGNCPATIRAGVHILAGRVLPNDQDYSVGGQVTPTGAIRVNVSAAGQTAGGFGRLSRDSGQGLWRTSSGECSGQWTAERREVRDGNSDNFALRKAPRPTSRILGKCRLVIGKRQIAIADGRS